MESPLWLSRGRLLSGVLGLGLLGSAACTGNIDDRPTSGPGAGSSTSAGTGATGAGASGSSAGGTGAAGATGPGGAGGGGSGGMSTLPTDTEGDGDFEVGPDYTTDPDLTDLGAPQGKSFSFQMSSMD